MINIYTGFTIKTKNGLDITGSMLIPYEKDTFYKPIRVWINDGVIDTMHRQNTGSKSEPHRIMKDSLIGEWTSNRQGAITHAINKPFLLNKGCSMGFLTICSSLIGINTNRGVNMNFKGKYKMYSIPEIFRNIKSYNGLNSYDVVAIDNIQGEVKDSLNEMIFKYEKGYNGK